MKAPDANDRLLDGTLPHDAFSECEPMPPPAEVPAAGTATAEPDPRRSFKLTDYGNAERLVTQHGADLRFCTALGGWLTWDGLRWERDELREVTRRAKATVRALYEAAAREPDADRRTKLAQHAARCEASPRIEAMIHLAESELPMPVAAKQFDADPWLLTCPDGTIDLRTGELRPARREDLITKLAPVHFDPAADCPLWLAFLDRIFAGDAELIGFIQRLLGSGLSGHVSEQVFPIFYGGGANGKTTLIDVVVRTLGDYAQIVPVATLMKRRNASGIPNDIARLRGVRLAFASESEEGERLAVALVKSLTGRDKLTARFMRGEFFDFFPSHKLIMSTNNRPEVEETKRAIWRRLRLVPFAVTIPEIGPGKQDEKLPDTLFSQEAPAIVRWLLDGCLAWQKNKLGCPSAVRVATDRYREESDAIGRFLDEQTTREQGAAIRASELYRTYREWAEAGRERPVSEPMFARRMKERDEPKERRRGGRYYIDRRLRDPGDPAAPEEPDRAGQGAGAACSAVSGVPGSEAFSGISLTREASRTEPRKPYATRHPTQPAEAPDPAAQLGLPGGDGGGDDDPAVIARRLPVLRAAANQAWQAGDSALYRGLLDEEERLRTLLAVARPAAGTPPEPAGGGAR